MRKITEDQLFELTAKNKTPFVVMPLETYESMMATIEELNDPGVMEALRESSEDIKMGRVYPFEKVVKELELQD